MKEYTKSAFIAILGRPNAGKSTLLNAIIGEKVAIVSPKPQTTRNRITGILTRKEMQLIFIDTPGIHKARTRLSEYMNREIGQGAAGVDAAILVTDASGEIRESESQLLESLNQRKLPAVLALNKIDLLPRKELMLEKMREFSQRFTFEAMIPISALKKDGIDLLLDSVSRYGVPGPHYFDDNIITDQPEQVLAAELLREKLLYHLREEIPHGIAVCTEQMKERPSGNLLDLSLVIYCEKNSHKGMIIGKNGAMLKKAAAEARRDLEILLEMKVNLQCWVKVKEDWRNREGSLRQLGFH